MIEFMIDSANINAIKRLCDTYPIAGVTSNPSILKSEGKIDFFPHMKKVREIIGTDRSLHIQVIASDFQGMIKDAETILRKIDEHVYIKIPSTSEGLKTMGNLHIRGIRITATAIYTRFQGLMALARGVDYIALYSNRMKTMDIDAEHTMKFLRHVIDRDKLSSKLLAASFRNIRQTADAMMAGVHSITATPEVIDDAFSLSIFQSAVDSFHHDWVEIHGDVTLADLGMEK
ncbi:MAG: fructose-6-phosphate aldolase [Treponema sp.]|jgi:TalC/MipB family fructose-6-phosphate aldolase|nr:fructose-6-phosphate aldolase [Treponema sp.]